jgi:hypothetical protein
MATRKGKAAERQPAMTATGTRTGAATRAGEQHALRSGSRRSEPVHLAPAPAAAAPLPATLPLGLTPPAAEPRRSSARARPSVRQRLGELREALAEGYEIVQPIFARPLWSVTDNSTTAFNFVLRRECATKLVTIPEGRTVQRFIRERHLLVDYQH